MRVIQSCIFMYPDQDNSAQHMNVLPVALHLFKYIGLAGMLIKCRENSGCFFFQGTYFQLLFKIFQLTPAFLIITTFLPYTGDDQIFFYLAPLGFCSQNGYQGKQRKCTVFATNKDKINTKIKQIYFNHTMDFFRMIAFQFCPLNKLSKLLMGVNILAKMHPFQVKY